MRRRKEAPAMPAGYLDALGKLYGGKPVAGAETPLERTQPTEALPIPTYPKESGHGALS